MLAQSRDPHKLAQLWIDGLLSDCRGLPHAEGRRTSLPTYPFADKRHWIGTGKVATRLPSAHARSGVHPLIDSNESTFQRQLFKKAFHAREFFMRDHVVSGIPTLPGTAYLDLARKAGEIAAGRKVRRIRNVTWVSPLAVEGDTPREAFVELKPSADSVLFEVFSETADGEKRLYSQGKLLYATGQDAAAAQAEYIDLAAIRARCTRSIAAQDAYALFKALGMAYGPSFQVLQQVLQNDDEVLGVLQCPDVRNADFDDFVLHPCILDAAMQAGFVAQLGDASGEMKVPYSIGEVEILHPLTRTCYSHLTKAKGDRGAGSGVSRANVTIVDETGKVLARIRGPWACRWWACTKRAPVRKEPKATTGGRPAVLRARMAEVAVARPAARRERRSPLRHRRAPAQRLRRPQHRRRAGAAGDRFEAAGPGTYRIKPRDRQDYGAPVRRPEGAPRRGGQICYAWPDASEPRDEEALGKALERGVYSFLHVCQALVEQKLKGRVQLLYLHAAAQDGAEAHNDAINGFARSLRLEHPRIDCKVLEIQQGEGEREQALDAVLAELHPDAQDNITVRYRGGVRCARVLEKVDLTERAGAAAPGIGLKRHGVYLITGGAGGLGLIFAIPGPAMPEPSWSLRAAPHSRPTARPGSGAAQPRRAGALCRGGRLRAKDVRRLLARPDRSSAPSTASSTARASCAVVAAQEDARGCRPFLRPRFTALPPRRAHA
jgi:acyl transferase domain-containing protein